MATEERVRVRRLMLLITMAILTTLLLGTLVLPLLRVPDEKYHADMVLVAKEGDWIDDGWPGLGARRLDRSVNSASDRLLENGRADSAEVGRPRPALEDVGPDGNSGLNRAAQHPPLFYLMSGGVSWLVDAGFGDLDFVEELWSFRLMSVLATVALPIVFYLVTSELTTSTPIRIAAAIIPLVVPGLTLRDGSMINNDALLILWSSLSILLAIRLARGDLRMGNTIVAGMAAGLAMLTKGFGMFAVPVIAVAYLIMAVRERRVIPRWFLSVAVSSVSAILFGGWWWLRNLIVEGRLLTFRAVERSPDFVPDWGNWATTGVQQLVGSFWGGSFALPARGYMWLFWTLSLLLLGACMVGLIRSKRRDLLIVSLLFGIILLIAIPVGSARLYLDRGAVKGVHGRYFYAAIAGVFPVALMGIASVARRMVRWIPAVVVTGAMLMNALALRSMLGQYWRPFGASIGDQWHGVTLWSPLPDWSTNLLLVATLFAWGAVLVMSLQVAVAARRSSSRLVMGTDAVSR